MPQNIGYLTADKTTAGDERFTPYYAVEPLLEFLPPADTGITIWCPFDEFWSAYVQTFRANGYNVVYGSLATGQDFFTSQPAHWDIMFPTRLSPKKMPFSNVPVNSANRSPFCFLQTAFKASLALKSFRTTFSCFVLILVLASTMKLI